MADGQRRGRQSGKTSKASARERPKTSSSSPTGPPKYRTKFAQRSRLAAIATKRNATRASRGLRCWIIHEGREGWAHPSRGEQREVGYAAARSRRTEASAPYLTQDLRGRRAGGRS